MDQDYELLLNPERATTDAEFEATWERLLNAPPLKGDTKPSNKESRRLGVRRTIPRVGTIVQRSSHTTQRKLKALLEAPPPPPPRRRGTTKQKQQLLKDLFGDISDLSDEEATPEKAAKNLATPPINHGPEGPPPIEVTVGTTTVQVPYFSAMVSRKWRTRINGRRATLRFDRTGRCTFARVE